MSTQHRIDAEADGLDVMTPDSITPQEMDAFRKFHAWTKGKPMSYGEFWFEQRVDVLKRYRAVIKELTILEEVPWFPHLLAWLHYYAIVGYEEGIKYMIRSAHTAGGTKAEIMDTLAIAFLHCGPRGMAYVVHANGMDLLRTEPEPQLRWPEGWSFDPKAFDSGVDFSSREATAEDMARIRDWYLKTLGEVPRYVDFLAQYRPRLLKAYRNRFEHTIRDGLPKQMMPYLLLHYNGLRGFRDGIREAVLLGRAMGMTRPQLLDAIVNDTLYGGFDAISIIDEAAGDVLSTME